MERKTFTDRDAVFLEHLEGRRQALDASLWQGPALTIAAQAFLLAVLTDEAVPRSVRWVVLLAGVMACVAAAVSLVRIRAREVLYSEAIAYYCDEFQIRDPRPDTLARMPAVRHGRMQRLDSSLREFFGGDWLPPGYWFWLASLSAFVIADVVALVCT